MHDDSLAGNSMTVHPLDDSRADDEVDGMFVMYVGFFVPTFSTPVCTSILLFPCLPAAVFLLSCFL